MKPHLIVALDTQSEEEAMGFFKKTKSKSILYKVGLELYTVAGPQFVRSIIDQGARVFLDLKIYDIPNTMAGAARSIEKLGVEMFTFHLSSGAKGIEAVLSETKRSLALGVTALTSFTDQTWIEAGHAQSVSQSVTSLISLGAKHGLNGIVCSPQELASGRKQFPQMKFVVPGIRPEGSAQDDQARVMTPREAAKLGPHGLVMGRPIYKAADPLKVIDQILAEIQ